MSKNDTTAEGSVLEATAEAPTVGPRPKPPVNASGFYVYIGPSLRGLIRNGQVFRGSRAKALREAAEAVRAEPLVRRLIVSGDALPEARRKVKTPGNALYANYRKANKSV